MHFDHPAILLLLWLLPGVAALLVVAHRRRIAAAERFVAAPMVARLMPDLRGSRPWIKASLLILGLTLLIVAAARPKFGVYYEKARQRGVDCFVLLDVSRSMLAEDVVPNRLARAKSDIGDLLKKLPGDRVGLIVFAGKPVLKVPLTTDDGFYRMVLNDVDTHSAPRGGTLIGDAIRKALDSLPPKTADHDQILVLLTDGEDQDSYPVEAAQQAAKRGVKIFTIGLGDSAEGARIPFHDEQGKLQFVKDEGREHWSKADQSALRKIAEITGGVHVPAGTKTYDLGEIYENHFASLTRGEESQEMGRRRLHEQFQIFLALGFALLAVDWLIPPYRKNGRGRHGCNFGVTAILFIACTLGFSTMGAAPADAAWGVAVQRVNQGIDAFRGGNFKAASEAFGEAAKKMPNEPKIAFDRGCAFAAQGDGDKAVEQFRIAAASQNRELAAMAQYNLGCLSLAQARAKLGKKPEEAKPEVRKDGLELLDEAAGHLRECVTVDPKNADARYNLETLRLWSRYIQKAWRDRDLKERRLKMNLLQFVEWMEKQQRELRANSRQLVAEEPSPRHREAVRAVEYAQSELAEEIEPLKEKIHAALTQTTGGTTAQPTTTAAAKSAPVQEKQLGPEAQKALTLLNTLADDAGASMRSATDALAAVKPADAARPQADAIEKLDSVFMVVSPFVDLVKKGIATEEQLIAKSKGTAGEAENESATAGSSSSAANGNGKNAAGQASGGAHAKTDADWPDAAWEQRFISNYGRILGAKAKRELEQLEKTPAAAMPQAVAAQPTAPGVKNANGQPAGQPDPEKQKKEMRRALQAGIDLSPKVVERSNEAASQLDASKPAAALPPQEETLKLLKEMLPKDQNQKNQDQKNQQNQQNKDQNKQNQDKKNQDQKNQDKQNQDQKDNKKDKDDKQNQDKKNQDQKDQQKKDQQKQDQPKDRKQDQQKQQAEREKQNPTEQRAEAALRQVRDRQKDRREMQKVLLEKLYRPEKVDKDW